MGSPLSPIHGQSIPGYAEGWTPSQGKSAERVGRLEEKIPRGGSWHSSLIPVNGKVMPKGKLPLPLLACAPVNCPHTAFVIFCKSFGGQQGIPTSDSLTPLGSDSTEPLVPTATASWDPGCSQAMGASLGSVHTRGPFCPCPSTAGSGQNTASLSAPAGPAPAWPGVNCLTATCPPPVLRREQEPSPKHWRFVRGSRAEWWVCVAGNAGGREADRLFHLFTWKWRSGPGAAATAAALSCQR